MGYEDDQDEIIESAREIESLRARVIELEVALEKADILANSYEFHAPEILGYALPDSIVEYREARAARSEIRGSKC